MFFRTHPKTRNRIARRVIIAIILFSSLITLVTTSFQIYKDYSYNIRQIEGYVDMIEAANLKPIAESLWSYDHKLIQLQLNQLLKLPGMIYLSVNDNKGTIWAVGTKQDKYVMTRNYPLVYRSNNREYPIGSLSIIASLSSVYRQLLAKAVIILISNTIKTFLVAGFALIIFQLMVTRYLFSIADYAQKLELKPDSPPLDLGKRFLKGTHDDELDEVVHAINKMRWNLTQTYAELSESEARFRALVEASNDIIWAIDADLLYTYVSPSFKRHIGYDPSEVIGKSPLTFFTFSTTNDNAEQEDKKNRDGLTSKWLPVRGHESVIVSKDGKKLIFETNAVPVFDVNLNFTGYQGITRDITERKKTEAKLSQYRKNLEEKVEKRTAELEIANKELESFAYSVSHDLRAPLRAMDGFSLALLEDYEGKLDDQGKDFLHRIRNNSNKMAILIDDMLKLSRVNRMDMQKTTVNLSRIVADILDNLQIHDPHRRVVTKIKPDVSVQGDPAYIRVALENLLGNAWKFTSKKETGRIEFGQTETLVDKKPVFFVRDNGAGFHEEYKHKLFGVFQRLHDVEEFPGTGVGLAIVKRVMDRHDGKIWAESKLNEGATFFFSV